MMSTAAQDHTKDASEAKHLKDSASDKPKDKVKYVIEYVNIRVFFISCTNLIYSADKFFNI